MGNEAFLERLVNTKPPLLYAESWVFGDGRDWHADELSILGDVVVAVRVEVFDAASVGAGPIATLAGTNRETIPLVLHSAWTPAYHELADAERLRFSDEVTAETLASVPDELHAAVHAVADECDGTW